MPRAVFLRAACPACWLLGVSRLIASQARWCSGRRTRAQRRRAVLEKASSPLAAISEFCATKSLLLTRSGLPG